MFGTMQTVDRFKIDGVGGAKAAYHAPTIMLSHPLTPTPLLA